jgi:hypothetical protein
MILLTRDNFRESVFKRDSNKCVICKEPGVDAHHILDRKLFEDGGYYLDNGATLCSECHIDAEKSNLTVEQIREAAGITNIILPSGLLPGVIYDKWGNAEDYNAKYPRSLHSPISLGTTSDDRFVPKGYVEVYIKRPHILTEKLDGQNTSFNKVGVYARSHSAPTEHPWDKPMVELWKRIKNDLGDIELFGESMYAIHSIEYKNLESYFYLFGVRQNGVWLSWEEVKWWAAAFDFPTVPEIKIKYPLSQIIQSPEILQTKEDENVILSKWLKMNLGMHWTDYVNTSGQLGGFEPLTPSQMIDPDYVQKPCCEGFVCRLSNSYKVNEGLLPVEKNEFDSLFKLVRPKHVKTDIHWTRNWKPAKLKWEYEAF